MLLFVLHSFGSIYKSEYEMDQMFRRFLHGISSLSQVENMIKETLSNVFYLGAILNNHVIESIYLETFRFFPSDFDIVN